MKASVCTLALLAACAIGSAAAAQTTQPAAGYQTRPAQPGATAPAPRPLTAEQQQRRQQAMSGEPDVLLDVPNLSIQSIDLEVNNLEVHLALEAKLANLLHLKAGADASIEQVKLNITGVQATALLVVRLDNVRAIIDRTLTTIDNNPQLVERLLQSVDTTVGTVGGVANNAVGTVGTIAGAALRPGSTLDPAAMRLTPLTQGTMNSAGQTVRQFRDASGAVLEVVTDRAGRVVSSRRVR